MQIFLHSVHFVIFNNFAINFGTGTYFVYYKYLNPSKKVVNNKDGSGIQTLIY